MRRRYREMDMKRLITLLAFAASLAFTGVGHAQDKPKIGRASCRVRVYI